MPTAKIAITIDQSLLNELDQLVKENRFANRSRAVQEALRDKLQRLKRTRLARACAKVNRKVERDMAEEWLAGERELWPEY